MSEPSNAHILILDAQGAVLVSTLPEACRKCPSASSRSELTTACGFGGKRRRGRADTPDGSVFICTNDKDFVASNRLFKRELEFYVASLGRLSQARTEIAKAEALKTRRLLHNLISLNAHALQEIYSVIEQERLANWGSFRSQEEMLEREFSHRPRTAARLFLMALKNAAATKNELAVFRKLHEPSPKLSFAAHTIHRVILNVSNYFFQDFADAQLRLLIDRTSARLNIDYESMQVALYHILDNAVKYACPHSDIRVAFQSIGTDFEVRFEMRSLFLDEAERKRVHEDGVSGAQASALGKSGQGLGMRLIAELAKLNRARFIPVWGPTESRTDIGAGPRYATNRFSLVFPANSVVPTVADHMPRKGANRQL
jgi:signal transduction histidine kinase